MEIYNYGTKHIGTERGSEGVNDLVSDIKIDIDGERRFGD